MLDRLCARRALCATMDNAIIHGVVAKYPLDEIRDSQLSHEITALEIARRTGRHPTTVSRALRGDIDPPESTVREYHQALLEIRAERAAAVEAARAAAVPVGHQSAA